LDRRLPDIETLTSEADAWEGTRNEAATAVTWRSTTADARIKIEHVYPSHQT
jgi:hypothetical protein